MDVFEKISLKFPEVVTEIVEDEVLGDIPGRCIPDFKGNFTIQIKDSIYTGATKGVGGYRAHIMHEISHVLLFIIGFNPIVERSYKNNVLEPCESVEWQAKALTGEIMVPFEDTKNMTCEEIIEKCGVSKDCAEKRLKIRN